MARDIEVILNKAQIFNKVANSSYDIPWLMPYINFTIQGYLNIT